MAPHSSRTDPLVTSQQYLFAQIKRSHRLFVAQLYVAFLFIPLIAVLILLFGPYLQVGISDLMSVVPFLAIFGILGIKQIKETYSFFRSSGRYFYEIEHATDPSQVARGLTTYVNHFVKLLQPPSLLTEEPPTSLPERLDRIENHMRKGVFTFLLEFILSGMVIAGLVTFFIIAYPEILGQLKLYAVIAVFFIIPGIRLWLFLWWRPLVKRWLLGYQELVTWGENLERLVLHQQIEGGRDL
ncbi:MAG: hypothetical protein ACE5R6_12060 [Candidatus Heimdallarchaeota archaeon]